MKPLTIIALALIALTIVAFTALPLAPTEAAQDPHTSELQDLQSLQDPLDVQDLVATCVYDKGVKWNSSPIFKYNNNFPSTLISDTNSGAALWNNINGLNFDITLSSQTTTATFNNQDFTNVIDIVWRAAFNVPQNAVGLTATWSFLEIAEADIALMNDVYIVNEYNSLCENSSFHTQSVAVHEFGHAIGLNDYNGDFSVMNIPIDFTTCNVTLWVVDRECAFHIYGTVPVSCGDGFCDPNHENESDCPEDCAGGGCKRGATGPMAMVPGSVQNDFVRLLRDYTGNRADAYLNHNHLAELDLIINSHKNASKATNSFIVKHLAFLESQATDIPQKLSEPVVDDLKAMIDVLSGHASKPLKKKLREIKALFQRSVNLSIREAVDQYLAEAMTVPEHFELVGNYPNPFNPSTVIEYRLAETSHVTVSVYDVMGRLVSTLVDARQSAGTQRMTFDAAGLPSGTYLYSVKTAGGVKTGTMQLVK